jgi:hypothetical protein
MFQRHALFLGLIAVTVSAAAADLDALTRETREATQPLLGKVVNTVKETLRTSTPHETVDICREKLPGMVKDIREQTGWNIRRVSLKTRNAERGTPDDWEARVLAEFDRRAAAGEKRELLEVGEVVATAEGPVFRYMKALPVQEACLTCHGDATKLSPELKAKLATLYPADRATGYELGQIRGALTVKRALPAGGK